MRQNGHGALTLEDARTWIEETGLCLFVPKRQFSQAVAPSFVEAVAGQRNATPEPNHVALAEELLVRLETDGVAVRLNLLGHPSEQPDFVVASWVLPYVYALRGDRDWRRVPQLTGSRQVSQLAVQAYKLLETGDATVAHLKHTLGREVTETAVLRAITELWQQLRIIPVVAAPGSAARWQPLRQRYQKAIAEGASTSQVTAISVLASIYLQAVIAASMEEVEMFLAPLTARSKVREVLRGLVATRQVHTISMGHAPHFYVAGTLPEFTPAPTMYSSSSMPASAYFLHGRDHEDEAHEPVRPEPVLHQPVMHQPGPAAMPAPRPVAEHHAPRMASPRKPAAAGKPQTSRTHFSRPAVHGRDHKPGQAAPAGRTTRHSGAATSGAKRTSAATGGNGARSSARPAGPSNGTRPSNGTMRPGGTGRPSGAVRSNGAMGNRSAKNAAATGGPRNGHAKPASKAGVTARSSSHPRGTSAPRKDTRPAARGGRKPALAATAKSSSGKRFSFAGAGKQTKKRG